MQNRDEDILLRHCAVQSRRSCPKFQRCLLHLTWVMSGYDDGGCKHLRHVGQLLGDCMLQYPRRLLAVIFILAAWEPETSISESWTMHESLNFVLLPFEAGFWSVSLHSYFWNPTHINHFNFTFNGVLFYFVTRSFLSPSCRLTFHCYCTD
jgi:hypothetical protein